MSKDQTFRALVTERLAAAAEDIIVLFERTIAEYEEDLCRPKEENQRRLPQHLDEHLFPKLELVRGNVHNPSKSPDPDLSQDLPETAQIKEEPEEQRVKVEEDPLPESVPEFSTVCVKKEESSLFQQRHTEHREETQRAGISSGPHFHSDCSSNNNNDWNPPFNCSAAQMETEADLDAHNQIQTRDIGAAQNSVLPLQNKTGNNRDTDQEAEAMKREHSFSLKRFTYASNLQMHSRSHTGKRPYTCAYCNKTFLHSSSLKTHTRVHTGEKPYSCTLCEKTFAHSGNLNKHLQFHSGERPYGCSVCLKQFTMKNDLKRHMSIHTREKPYRCSVCGRGYSVKSYLDKHMGTHSG